MNAAQKRKLKESLKVLEKEGLVFRGVTDYSAQRRLAVRQLKVRIRKYDRATTAFFESHFTKDHWDSQNSADFFGNIRRNRAIMYRNLQTLHGEQGTSEEWDSDPQSR